jgi:carbonic anhydrase
MHQAFRALLRGNSEHAAGSDGVFDALQIGQRPDVVTVCCSDSRVRQEHMWGAGEPGDVFTCSNIGNRVTQLTEEGETVSGDVLYPIEHAGTDLVVVVGHTGCGAVTAAYDELTGGISEPSGIAHCVGLVASHLKKGVDRLPPELDRTGAINHLVEYNVDRQVERLVRSEDVPEAVTVVGCVYDFQDVYGGRRGEIHVGNVDGRTDVGALRDDHPKIGSRIRRLREY